MRSNCMLSVVALCLSSTASDGCTMGSSSTSKLSSMKRSFRIALISCCLVLLWNPLGSRNEGAQPILSLDLRTFGYLRPFAARRYSGQRGCVSQRSVRHDHWQRKGPAYLGQRGELECVASVGERELPHSG